MCRWFDSGSRHQRNQALSKAPAMGAFFCTKFRPNPERVCGVGFEQALEAYLHPGVSCRYFWNPTNTSSDLPDGAQIGHRIRQDVVAFQFQQGRWLA